MLVLLQGKTIRIMSHWQGNIILSLQTSSPFGFFNIHQDLLIGGQLQVHIYILKGENIKTGKFRENIIFKNLIISSFFPI